MKQVIQIIVLFLYCLQSLANQIKLMEVFFVTVVKQVSVLL